MRIHLITFIFLIANYAFGQSITGLELLDKTITYHDPDNNWSTFNATFNVFMETPDSPERKTNITINIPDESFHSITTVDSVTTQYSIVKGKCVISKTDSLRIANQDKKPKRSHCETTELYKNYYTYLYGLPMKLKDPGTNIDKVVEQKTFKGKDYLVLKATYDEGVGTDVWYFYFDPNTFAMEVYQFFKTDEKGAMKKDSGEYILLTQEATISNIKMPKVRAWYYNKDDKYLGTDRLK